MTQAVVSRWQGTQYAMGPTSFSTSAMSTMTMASQGQPSRKQPSGPLLRHFLQPMHWRGSIWMRPNGGLSSSGTQNMQSSTGQYSTQAGDPAQPVQHSVITASSFGFFLRAVAIPFERGSNFCSSGTIPGALTTSGALAISSDSTLSVKSLSAWFLPQSCACYNARAIGFIFRRTHVYQATSQTSRAGFAGRTRFAALLHLALPLLFRRYRLLRRTRAQLAVPRRLRILFARAASCFGRSGTRISGVSCGDLLSVWYGPEGGYARAGLRRSCDVRAGRRNRLSSRRGRFRRGSWPRCRGCALADGALSLYRQLRGGSAHGSSGDIFHYARPADFFVACGNRNRAHSRRRRTGPRGKDLVCGRARRWFRHACSPGGTAASCGCTDRALGALSPSRELGKTCARNAVDVRWIAAAADAVGRAQCGHSWTRAISCAAIRGNVRRRIADRILRVDENVDVSFSRCVSLHMEIAVAADRFERSSGRRGGFPGGIFARRFPTGALQSRARHERCTRS